MPIFANYSLQKTVRIKKHVEMLPYVAAGLRLLSLASIIPCVTVSLYFLFAVFVPIAASFCTDYLYKRNAYTLVCTCRVDYLSVKKVYFDEKEKELHHISYGDIFGTTYEDATEEKSLLIETTKGENVSVPCDDYLYASIEIRRKEQDGLSR